MFTDGQKCANSLINLRVVRKLFDVELKANILTKLCVEMAVHPDSENCWVFLERNNSGENLERKVNRPFMFKYCPAVSIN